MKNMMDFVRVYEPIFDQGAPRCMLNNQRNNQRVTIIDSSNIILKRIDSDWNQRISHFSPSFGSSAIQVAMQMSLTSAMLDRRDPEIFVYSMALSGI